MPGAIGSGRLSEDRRDLVERHLGFAFFMGRYYARANLEDEEACAEGAYGMCLAAVRYVPDRGSFLAYAKPWIRHRVQTAIRERHLVRPADRHFRPTAYRPKVGVRDAERASRPPMSLDVHDPRTGRSRGVALPDRVEDRDYGHDEIVRLGAALEALNPRERAVIEVRFGLSVDSGGEPGTWKEAGRAAGISRTWAVLVYGDGMAHLRSFLEAHP